MPQRLRALYLAVWGGASPPHGVTTKLYYLDAHFPRAKIEEALTWLVRNKLTGLRFVEWFEGDCMNSSLEMHRKLIRAVERERHTRKLYAVNDLRGGGG